MWVTARVILSAWLPPVFSFNPTFGKKGRNGCPEFGALQHCPAWRRAVGQCTMTVRLLTNIGRLWTGSEIWSNAAILAQDDRIAWVGPASELPTSIPGVIHNIVDVDHMENLGGALVTPGLIDSHTHPVYAGNRWAEVAMRSGGSSTAEIAAAGGGDASTVTITRGTDPWTLCSGVRERLRAWLQNGATTVETKTGYHLTRDGE